MCVYLTWVSGIHCYQDKATNDWTGCLGKVAIGCDFPFTRMYLMIC